jgi:hypothetical protein
MLCSPGRCKVLSSMEQIPKCILGSVKQNTEKSEVAAGVTSTVPRLWQIRRVSWRMTPRDRLAGCLPPILPLNTEFKGARRVNRSFPERCVLRPACLRRSTAVETSDSEANSNRVLATGRKKGVQKLTVLFALIICPPQTVTHSSRNTIS